MEPVAWRREGRGAGGSSKAARTVAGPSAAAVEAYVSRMRHGLAGEGWQPLSERGGIGHAGAGGILRVGQFCAQCIHITRCRLQQLYVTSASGLRAVDTAPSGSEQCSDNLTNLARAMDNNCHWDNLSFWTFGQHNAFHRLASCTAVQLLEAYLGTPQQFKQLWMEGATAAAAAGAAGLEAAGAGADLQGLISTPAAVNDGPQLRVCDVCAVAALGHLGDWLSHTVPPTIPPLEQYIQLVAANDTLPLKAR